MSKAFILGAVGVASLNLADPNNAARKVEVDLINSIKGLTWKAAMPEKFAGLAPGASKSLLGVKYDQVLRVNQKIKSGEIVEHFATVNFVAPDTFDSATNWPKCADVINDIRDQSNCGCCWAFGGASAASDRLCIATDGAVTVPISAADVCFGASSDGCGGGYLDDTWDYVKKGAVSGGQQDDTGALGGGFCQAFPLPHCHHHGPQGQDPYPAEGAPGCPSEDSPRHASKCDSGANTDHNTFSKDKYSFSGQTVSLRNEKAIQQSMMKAGPVETAFTVYGDFENYAGGVYSQTSTKVLGGHAVRIVGWGVDAGTKYWKVANSWNPFWGEEGYFRIKRGDDECGIESQAMASGPNVKWSGPGVPTTSA